MSASALTLEAPLDTRANAVQTLNARVLEARGNPRHSLPRLPGLLTGEGLRRRLRTSVARCESDGHTSLLLSMWIAQGETHDALTTCGGRISTSRSCPDSACPDQGGRHRCTAGRGGIAILLPRYQPATVARALARIFAQRLFPRPVCSEIRPAMNSFCQVQASVWVWLTAPMGLTLDSIHAKADGALYAARGKVAIASEASKGFDAPPVECFP